MASRDFVFGTPATTKIADDRHWLAVIAPVFLLSKPDLAVQPRKRLRATREDTEMLWCQSLQTASVVSHMSSYVASED